MRGDVSSIFVWSQETLYTSPPLMARLMFLSGKRPMVYELVGDETVADVIAMASVELRLSRHYQRKSDELGLASASTLDLRSALV